MKVLNCSQSANQYKLFFTPNFTGNRREVFTVVNGVKTLSHRNNSCFFRADLDWPNDIDKEITKYRDVDTVHSYIFGCSGGEEAFSKAMLLIKKFEEGAKKFGKGGVEKFFPIRAFDIDPKILENPAQGILKLTKSDIRRIKDIMGNNYPRFIELDNEFKYDRELNDVVCTGRIKPILQDKIIFEQGDIRKYIASIPKRDNTVVMCRNFWPYLSEVEQEKLAKDLYEKLGDNSIVIIGEYDFINSASYDARTKLLNAGFKYLNEYMDNEDLGVNEYSYFIKKGEKEPPHDPGFWMNTYINKN